MRERGTWGGERLHSTLGPASLATAAGVVSRSCSCYDGREQLLLLSCVSRRRKQRCCCLVACLSLSSRRRLHLVLLSFSLSLLTFAHPLRATPTTRLSPRLPSLLSSRSVCPDCPATHLLRGSRERSGAEGLPDRQSYPESRTSREGGRESKLTT